MPDQEKPSEIQPQEIQILAMVLGGAPNAAWYSKEQPYDFFTLKGILEALFLGLGLDSISFRRASRPYLHPGRTAEIALDGQVIGVMGEVHPLVAEAYELTGVGRVLAAELELDKLLNAALERGNKAHDLPKYPASTRDIALIGPAAVPAAEIEAAIRSAGGDYLENVRLFDLYDKEPIPAGQRSLAFALQFRAEERTLTDSEAGCGVRRYCGSSRGEVFL